MYDVFARFFFFAWPLLVLGGDMVPTRQNHKSVPMADLTP